MLINSDKAISVKHLLQQAKLSAGLKGNVLDSLSRIFRRTELATENPGVKISEGA